MSVRIGLGVCWVEFQDFEGAQRAALRDNTETGGHSLRVALLHPQPPPVLRQRLGAGAAEWQPESSQEVRQRACSPVSTAFRWQHSQQRTSPPL